MNVTVREWIQTGREKYHTGKLSDRDFDRLAQLIETKKQKVLYLYSKSTSMRSQIFGWVLCTIRIIRTNPNCPPRNPPNR